MKSGANLMGKEALCTKDKGLGNSIFSAYLPSNVNTEIYVKFKYALVYPALSCIGKNLKQCLY